MGKISVDGFLREYSVAAKQNGSAMETFIKKHIVTDYVDFLTKSVHCEYIVDATSYIKDGDKKIVKINSINRFMLFTMRLIDLYTDIEINSQNIVGDYDKLNKAGALNVIISAIPDNEYAEFSTILNMQLDDFRDNQYSLTALLYNLKQSFSLSDEVLTEVLQSPEIQELVKNTVNKE